MSYKSAQAKQYTPSKKFVLKCRAKCTAIRRNYTDFSGSNISPLTKEQYKKAMKRYLEIKTHE